MPAGDGTGPTGMGPMTGRGVGYCGGYDAPGWANWGPGRRFYGQGRRGGRRGGYGPSPAYGGGGAGGGGRGWRHWYHATGLPRWARWGTPPAWAQGTAQGAAYGPPPREQEIEMLKDQAEWLSEQLEVINQRMDELSEE